MPPTSKLKNDDFARRRDSLLLEGIFGTAASLGASAMHISGKSTSRPPVTMRLSGEKRVSFTGIARVAPCVN